jgi:hypothetical protein
VGSRSGINYRTKNNLVIAGVKTFTLRNTFIILTLLQKLKAISPPYREKQRFFALFTDPTLRQLNLIHAFCKINHSIESQNERGHVGGKVYGGAESCTTSL